MHRLRHVRLAALLAVLALVIAACGGSDDTEEASGSADAPAASDAPDAAASDEAASDSTESSEGGGGGEADGEPISIGGIFDESGPTGDVGAPYAEGVRDYVAFRNADGGVGGRPIDLQSQDYQYDVAIAEQLYSQYTSDGVVAILGWGTADTEALKARVARDELPYFSGSLSEELADPAETPYNFLVGTTYSDQLRIALKHIAENADGHTEVAVFHNDSPFGESPLADGEAYIEDEGLDMGFQAYPMPSGATDYVAVLSRARDQGATHIAVQNVASPSAQLARDIQSQGLEVEMYCLVWCTDELFVELAGDAAEGTYGVTPWAPTTAEAEGLSEINAYLEENGSTVQEKGGHYVQGWFYAKLMATALEPLVESGEEITGAALKTSLEEMEPFETGGVSPPLDFTAESHKGTLEAPVFQVTDGAYIQIEEPITP